MKVLLFWYLQSQSFYKELHLNAMNSANIQDIQAQTWADMGCGTGLMSGLASKKGYIVDAYDLDSAMITFAKLLHRKKKNITFFSKDVMQVTQEYDIISATSLLSVVEDRTAVLSKLQSLLKSEKSKLIIIEPTQKMTLKNSYKMIKDFKNFYKYKMLLVWAYARQNKAVEMEVFDKVKNVKHHYFLNDMIRISIIQK